MKLLRQFSFIALAITLVLTSCTIEKRVYMPGYHIVWLNGRHSPDKQTTSNEIKKIKKNETVTAEQSETPTNALDNSFAQTSDNSITASLDNLPESITPNYFLSKEKIHFLKKSQIKSIITSEECDLLILKNGQEIKSKVLEVGTAEIKYKECSNLNGPTFSKNISEVFMIKYPNGTSTVISSDESKNTTNPSNTPSSGRTSNKSQLIALLLSIFLGGLGIHRFYLGHIGMGVLYLLTGGLCGIGWLIDIILILTGDLKPKDGEYKEKL